MMCQDMCLNPKGMPCRRRRLRGDVMGLHTRVCIQSKNTHPAQCGVSADVLEPQGDILPA